VGHERRASPAGNSRNDLVMREAPLHRMQKRQPCRISRRARRLSPGGDNNSRDFPFPILLPQLSPHRPRRGRADGMDRNPVAQKRRTEASARRSPSSRRLNAGPPACLAWIMNPSRIGNHRGKQERITARDRLRKKNRQGTRACEERITLRPITLTGTYGSWLDLDTPVRARQPSA
jgi:hypothetical protein